MIAPFCHGVTGGEALARSATWIAPSCHDMACVEKMPCNAALVATLTAQRAGRCIPESAPYPRLFAETVGKRPVHPAAEAANRRSDRVDNRYAAWRRASRTTGYSCADSAC